MLVGMGLPGNKQIQTNRQTHHTVGHKPHPPSKTPEGFAALELQGLGERHRANPGETPVDGLACIWAARANHLHLVPAEAQSLALGPGILILAELEGPAPVAPGAGQPLSTELHHWQVIWVAVRF